MNDFKTVVVVLSNEGPTYGPMVQGVRDTWAKEIPENMKVFYNYGDQYLKDRNIDEIPKGACAIDGIDGDILACNAPENYGFLMIKTICAFRSLLEVDEDWDYLVRPNCGSYVHLENLQKFLSDKARTKLYCGHTGEWDGRPGLKYVSGSCMIFSRDVIQLMVDHMEEIHYDGRTGIMDDVAIGEILKKYGVLPTEGKRVSVILETIREKFDPEAYHYHYSSTQQPACHYLMDEMVKNSKLEVISE
jgi:hypothetical protein